MCLKSAITFGEWCKMHQDWVSTKWTILSGIVGKLMIPWFHVSMIASWNTVYTTYTSYTLRMSLKKMEIFICAFHEGHFMWECLISHQNSPRNLLNNWNPIYMINMFPFLCIVINDTMDEITLYPRKLCLLQNLKPSSLKILLHEIWIEEPDPIPIRINFFSQANCDLNSV